ncbi:hypothetical protein L6270_01865 [Candidatus Parcubacteria bacterium]|nr:hypothetical protein [Patescibacteria group bacterium]MBU4309882.1 hypothetical protein [Patescibacteria group bacterium]MBU4431890.1 hypothetical protein [Patescibacteria group bacterium]MBU4578221.1 hypothetical protein [Patescibacteria group bacterium]MCG2696757.1 hypothetical protein [Candidatus Parcubacteria bacterium]
MKENFNFKQEIPKGVDAENDVEVEDDVIEEAALKYGIKAKLPNVGTPAYDRLVAISEGYAKEFLRTDVSVLARTVPRIRRISESERRIFHNQLCLMLFGTEHKDTSPNDKDRASRFSLYVSGNEDQIDF